MTIEQLRYFVLTAQEISINSASRKLHISPQALSRTLINLENELHLTGKLEDKEELLKELRNYLRQVFVINPKAEFNRSEISKIEEIPFDMQTLLLCE